MAIDVKCMLRIADTFFGQQSKAFEHIIACPDLGWQDSRKQL